MVIFLSLFISECFATDLRLVTDSWIPYEFQKEGKTQGASYEIIKVVFSQIGINIPDTIEEYPWARAELMLLNNEADGLFTGTFDEKRALKSKYVMEPLLESNWVLFGKPETIKNNPFKELSDLKGKVVGGVIGYSYPKEFIEYIKINGTLQLVSKDELNIRKLLVGRMEYAIADEMNDQALLRELKVSGLVKHEKPIASIPLYFIFSETVSDDIVKNFTIKLKEFKKTESYSAIVEKYK